MRDSFDRDRGFGFGWTCPSCDRNFNPTLDECKYCSLEIEKKEIAQQVKCASEIERHEWSQSCVCDKCKIITSSIADRQRIEEKLKGTNLSTFETSNQGIGDFKLSNSGIQCRCPKIPGIGCHHRIR